MRREAAIIRTAAEVRRLSEEAIACSRRHDYPGAIRCCDELLIIAQMNQRVMGPESVTRFRSLRMDCLVLNGSYLYDSRRYREASDWFHRILIREEEFLTNKQIDSLRKARMASLYFNGEPVNALISIIDSTGMIASVVVLALSMLYLSATNKELSVKLILGISLLVICAYPAATAASRTARDIRRAANQGRLFREIVRAEVNVHPGAIHGEIHPGAIRGEIHGEIHPEAMRATTCIIM